MGEHHIKTEKVGGGIMTNPATKASSYDEAGNKEAEAYASGHSAESQAESLSNLQDKLAKDKD